MNKQEKELLFKYLCAMLPYNVIVSKSVYGHKPGLYYLDLYKLAELRDDEPVIIKPYLRPMSSMTMEERIEFSRLLDRRYCEEDWEGHISTSYCIEIDNVYTDDEDGIKYPSPFSMEAIDWLNAHYFDYRGLIPMGLALPASEGMYETKSE